MEFRMHLQVRMQCNLNGIIKEANGGIVYSSEINSRSAGASWSVVAEYILICSAKMQLKCRSEFQPEE